MAPAFFQAPIPHPQPQPQPIIMVPTPLVALDQSKFVQSEADVKQYIGEMIYPFIEEKFSQ